MIRSEYSASCDACGDMLAYHGAAGLVGFWVDRDALLVALGSAGWGLLSGDSSDPAGWSVVCSSCRGGVK